MAVTQALLVQRVREILGDTPWMQAAASAAAGTIGTVSNITVSDSTKWDEGAILEFETGTGAGEQAWVTGVVNATTINAIRGVRGTTAPLQTTPVVVFRDPVYPYQNILDAADLVIGGSLWPYVYKKVTMATPITPLNTKFWYNIPGSITPTTPDALGLISVSQISTGTIPYLMKYGKKGSGYSVSFAMNLPTALVASSVGVAFPRGYYNMTNTIQVDYAAKYLPASGGSYADFNDGIDTDMIAYGVASRLVKHYEVNRVSDEDTGMGDQSVNPGQRYQTGMRLEAEFIKLRTLRNEELRRTIPLMSTGPGSAGLSDGWGVRGTAVGFPYP